MNDGPKLSSDSFHLARKGLPQGVPPCLWGNFVVPRQGGTPWGRPSPRPRSPTVSTTTWGTRKCYPPGFSGPPWRSIRKIFERAPRPCRTSLISSLSFRNCFSPWWRTAKNTGPLRGPCSSLRARLDPVRGPGGSPPAAGLGWPTKAGGRRNSSGPYIFYFYSLSSMNEWKSIVFLLYIYEIYMFNAYISSIFLYICLIFLYIPCIFNISLIYDHFHSYPLYFLHVWSLSYPCICHMHLHNSLSYDISLFPVYTIITCMKYCCKIVDSIIWFL